MYNPIQFVGVGLAIFLYGITLSLPVMAADHAVYDKPDVEVPGTTIYGKVVKVTEIDATKQVWDVAVENAATGDVFQLHIDKSTERKEKDSNPAVGDRVVVKFNDTSKHALTFVKDTPTKP